jgi:hypothetical protein
VLAQVVGSGNGGSSITTGFLLFQQSLGVLPAGTHTIVRRKKRSDDKRLGWDPLAPRQRGHRAGRPNEVSTWCPSPECLGVGCTTKGRRDRLEVVDEPTPRHTVTGAPLSRTTKENEDKERDEDWKASSVSGFTAR